MAEEDTIKLTTYQQSLVDEGRKFKFKRAVHAWVGVAVVATLGYGFYCEYNKTLPDYMHGWLIFATLALVIFNCIGAIAFWLISGLFSMTGYVVEKAGEEPWNQDNQKSLYIFSVRR